MWNILKTLFPGPTPKEQFWRFIVRRLSSDARLLASGLDAADRSPPCDWGILRIECEIVALRAWCICAALARGEQAEGEALIAAFEARFQEWLKEERSEFLNLFCIFSRSTQAEALTLLSEGWHRYDALARNPDATTPEKLGDVIALFWGGCVEGYTNKKIEEFLNHGRADIDRFIPEYVGIQIRRAQAKA